MLYRFTSVLSLIVFCLLYQVPAFASSYVEQLIVTANEKELAQTRAWRALLHYKPGVFSDWISQADDDNFFLAEDGNDNPEAELSATIRAMNEAAIVADQHPQCRFPARYRWLKEALNIDDDRLLTVTCPELELWFDTIRPGSLTLVFPSAYINSPSSMFGHTLLRVNPSDYRASSPLAAYALNYAANGDTTDNALTFTIKGLIGGYPGIFTIVPYYEKIKEYSDLENRDVWEYSLNFSSEEVDQLMRHAWEVRYMNFDYYFLTENCSYHMLSLMEVARPELDLTDAFGTKAIPTDTVRAVAEAGLVNEYVYRPSSTTTLTHHAAQMSENDNELVIGVTKESLPVKDIFVMDKEDVEKARIYEQSYDYSRFLSTADVSVRDVRSKVNWQLLAARSRLTISDVWSPIDMPEVRPEDSHGTGRVAPGVGILEDESYLSIQFRPAYHDVVDKVTGYSRAAQINFLDVNVRYYTEAEKLRLKKLTFINVLTLSPMNSYFSPKSWGVDIAVERQPTRQSATNAVQTVVDYGASARLYDYLTLSLLAEVDLKVASDFDKGYSAGGGAKFSMLVQEETYSLFSTLTAKRFVAGEENLHQQFGISFAYHLTFNDSLRLIFERSRDYDIYRSDVQFAYHRYF